MVLNDMPRALSQIGTLPPSPVAIIVNEDDVDLAKTLTHHRKLGFANLVLVTNGPQGSGDADLVLAHDGRASLPEIITALMPALAGRWIYAGYNAEYLLFPFCEARSIADVTQFVGEERREAVFCTTVDLYSDDLEAVQNGLGDGPAYFDRAGYFSRDRYVGPDRMDRQIDLFGGLKWRYAEHIPWHRQRIDRIALFRARDGLKMTDAFLFDDAEMNTINCPWHNNLTCAVASLRVAKSLLRNPGSTFDVERFTWDQSERFEWRSQQLMDCGLMEPGQWF